VNFLNLYGWFSQLCLMILELCQSIAVVPIQISGVLIHKPNRSNGSPTKARHWRKIAGRSRLINTAFIPSIRIFKRDIRRQYTAMWNNILNNHDCVLLSDFLTDYCVPGCPFISTFVPLSRPFGPPRIGISKIVEMTAAAQTAMPDSISRFSDTRIHAVYNETDTRIISSMKFKGTKLHLMDDRGTPQVFVSPVIEEKPAEMIVEGIFTIIVDELNRIKGFEMDCYLIQEP
jgi:hypothetical protein